MRIRVLIAAAVTASLLAVAVSKPNHQNGPQSKTNDAREISLAIAPGSAAPVVSALEAGHYPGSVPVVARRTLVRRPVQAAAPAADAADHLRNHLALALEPVVAMRSTTSTTAQDLVPAAAPLAAMPQGIPAVHAHDAEPRPEFVSSGPRIIIRGGMGSPHDDCKIVAPGHGAGAAVNRLAPSPGGGGYGRTGMSGGFRGGIR